MQNCAARVISRTRRNEHISPVLIDLHWLPVKQRSMFKILLYAFKALNCLAPAYLSELLKLYQPTRCLRSEQKSLLTKPIPRTKLYGNRRFDYASAALWNDLPTVIRSATTVTQFKKYLKTYLFRAVFY